MKTLLLAAISVFFALDNLAQEQTETLPVAPDTIKKERQFFELSLGQTVLFISDSKLEEIKNEEAIIAPTNARLFFAELRPDKLIRIPVFFNLPTGSKQYIVNGELISERASPTFGTGLEFRCFRFPIGKKSAVEFEAGPLASFLFDKNKSIRFAPIAAGRVRFLKNEDFVLYMGSSYSFGIDAVGILFGIGYVF